MRADHDENGDECDARETHNDRIEGSYVVVVWIACVAEPCDQCDKRGDEAAD